MSKDGIVFSDVDGTLCFHEEAHEIQKISVNSDNTLNVKTSSSDTIFKVYDVSVSSYNVYLDIQTQKLGQKVTEVCDFVYVTGGRKKTFMSRVNYLNFYNAVILENGGLILDNELNLDKNWYSYLEPDRKYLKEVRAQISAMDWILDDEGRTSALRVRLRDNLHKSIEQFEKLCETIQLPAELKKTKNLENLDIILAKAGKDKAVQYWMDKNNFRKQQSIGIGDDINDINFLRLTDRKFVLASAYDEVLETAKKEGWNISSRPYFDGINEILQKIIKLKI